MRSIPERAGIALSGGSEGLHISGANCAVVLVHACTFNSYSHSLGVFGACSERVSASAYRAHPGGRRTLIGGSAWSAFRPSFHLQMEVP
jgi:hypothetical protein